MPILEKTCQDYIVNPTTKRINLSELPVDTVVKNVGISQEPSRKLVVDNVVKPGKLNHINIYNLNSYNKIPNKLNHWYN